MLRAILQMMRLPNSFTAASNVLLGFAVAMSWDPTLKIDGHLTLASLGAILLYAFGMCLNDIVDVEKDQIEHPERVLPQGRITVRTAQLVATILLIGGLVCLGLAAPSLIFVGIVLCMFVVLYDVALKPWPVAASGAMGMCRFTCVLIGTVLGATLGKDWESVFRLSALLVPLSYLLLITTITAISNFESDEEEDTSIRPLIVILALALLSPLLTRGTDSLVTGILSLCLTGFILWPCRKPNPTAGLIVRNVIFALPLYDAVWAFAWGQKQLAGLSLGCYALLRLSAWALSQKTS